MLNMSGADPEGGGAGGARPPVLAPNSLKSPLNWPKYAQKLTPEPPASSPFSNPGSAPACSVVFILIVRANAGVKSINYKYFE